VKFCALFLVVASVPQLTGQLGVALVVVVGLLLRDVTSDVEGLGGFIAALVVFPGVFGAAGAFKLVNVKVFVGHCIKVVILRLLGSSVRGFHTARALTIVVARKVTVAVKRVDADNGCRTIIGDSVALGCVPGDIELGFEAHRLQKVLVFRCTEARLEFLSKVKCLAHGGNKEKGERLHVLLRNERTGF